MSEPQDKNKFDQEVIQLQNQMSNGKLTEEEFKKQLAELKSKHGIEEKEDQVTFKVKQPADKKAESNTGGSEIKQALVIEAPDEYSRKSSYSIEEVQKKIDRLDSEGVSRLRDRFKDKYGEELIVPDLHSENVRVALEDVKQYVDVDDVGSENGGDEVEKDEEKIEPEEDTGPSFFARLIARIKAFFNRILSFRKKKENPQIEETLAVSNGE